MTRMLITGAGVLLVFGLSIGLSSSADAELIGAGFTSTAANDTNAASRRGERRGPRGPRGLGVIIATLDANRDGQLSSDEINGATDALLALDADGDGNVTRSELAPARAGKGPRSGEDRAARFFDRHDLDENGSVSFEEFIEPARAHFDEIDANGDGAIDLEEANHLPKRPHRPHHPRGPRG